MVYAANLAQCFAVGLFNNLVCQFNQKTGTQKNQELENPVSPRNENWVSLRE